jgi:hypothetical protein
MLGGVTRISDRAASHAAQAAARPKDNLCCASRNNLPHLQAGQLGVVVRHAAGVALGQHAGRGVEAARCEAAVP